MYTARYQHKHAILNLKKAICELVVFIILIACTSTLASQKSEKGILIDTHGGIELRGDIYIPDGKGPFPGILYFHGGSFIHGARDDSGDVRMIEYFVSRGFAVFSADYRVLSDGGIFPNNIKDAKCALAWLKKNGAKYGVDAARIGVMGESAGAYLAAMVAFTPGEEYFSPDCGSAKDVDMTVKAAVLFYGPYDFGTIEGGFTSLLEIEIRRRARVKSGAQINEYKAKNSPVTYAKNAPPSLLINSATDSIVDPRQSAELDEALRKAGRVYEHFVAYRTGIDHGFILEPASNIETDNALALSAAFFDRQLNVKK